MPEPRPRAGPAPPALPRALERGIHVAMAAHRHFGARGRAGGVHHSVAAPARYRDEPAACIEMVIAGHGRASPKGLAGAAGPAMPFIGCRRSKCQGLGTTPIGTSIMTGPR